MPSVALQSQGFMTALADADPLFDQGGGGGRNFFQDFADIAKQSRASEASQYWLGS